MKDLDAFRDRITLFLVGSFVGALALMIFWGMPTTSKDIVTYMVGQLSGMTLMGLGYYFTKGAGEDAAAAVRSENTGKALDLAVAANASSERGKAADDVANAAAAKADEISGKAQ